MTHYEILELPENASAAEIRQAYRRLVLLTHPDRTPDPVAHARYLAINAAYEVLSDPGQRATYDFARQNPLPAAPPVSPGRARDAARRAAGMNRPRTGPVPTSTLYAAEYALTQRITKPFMILALLLSVSIIADYLLAAKHTERILSVETVLRGSGGRYGYNSTTTASFNNRTSAGIFSTLVSQPIGTALLVKRTPLWRVAISVDDAQQHPVDFMPLYSTPSAVMLLIMAVAAGLALWPSCNAEYRLMAAGLATILLIVIIAGLLSQ